MTVGVSQVEGLEIQRERIKGCSRLSVLGFVLNNKGLSHDAAGKNIRKGQAATGMLNSALRDEHVSMIKEHESILTL
jgi:hypothetical protein